MTSTTTFETMPHSGLSASEHSRQLRKAVVASTIGTTIEWYDFFIYGTAAGLIFGKLYFPNENPLTATLAAFGTYFIGFASRPIGAAIFGHYGDRIGRKGTLIATLLCMGIATFLIAFVPTYASIGIWGAVILTLMRMLQGRGWWGVGRLSPSGDGVVTPPWPAWVGCLVAAIWRSRWSVPRELVDFGVQRFVWGSVRHLGLASSFRALNHTHWDWLVDSSRHP